MDGERLELEHHQLDLRYGRLRLRREAVEERLLGSLAARGQLVPIVVVAVEPGCYRVIDGFRRIRGLMRLGQDTVWATVVALGELEALLLVRGLRSAAESAIEQAWLLAELIASFSLSGEELARRFDRSPSWVSRRLALVRVLPAEVQDAVRDGRISPHAAMRQLVPLARAKSAGVCRDVAVALARERLTSRETAQLVTLLRRQPAERWPRVLAAPRLALASAQRPREVEDDALRWLAALETVATTSQRLASTCPQLTAPHARCAREAAATAQVALSGLLEALPASPC